MTDAERAILKRLRSGPVLYLDFTAAEWAVVVELGKAGLAKWPEGSVMVEISSRGLMVLQPMRQVTGAIG